MKKVRWYFCLATLMVIAFCIQIASAESIDVSQLTPEQIAELQAQIDAMSGTQSSESTTSLQILNAMIENGAPISPENLTDFDEISDPNGLLGTPGSYTSKTDYGCAGYAKTVDGDLVGGTLEVFENEANAKSRFDYLVSVYQSMPQLIDCRVYLRGNAVLRISTSLLNDEVSGILNAFESVVAGSTEAFNEVKVEASTKPAENTASVQSEVTETHTEAEYAPIKRGDKGANVAKLQSRLKELGFLNDVADGNFGKNTEQAVLSFQKQNGLEETGIASPKDQVVLFGAGVISANGETSTAYDPYAVCPAEISRVTLKSSYGVPYVTFSITNRSNVSIKAVTYEIRFFDAFGDRLSGYNGAKFENNYAADLSYGKSASISTKDDYAMYDYEGVNYVAVAITRVLMEDGTDLTYSDPIWFEGK